MTLRIRNIAEIVPFAHAFEPRIGGRMADIGRIPGIRRIGLTAQTVAPGH